MSAGEDEQQNGDGDGDSETQTYAVGTLIDPDTQEPILAEDGRRIIIAEDEYTGETYLDNADDGATIGGEDNPDTDIDETLRVFNADGELVHLEDNSGNRLAEGGYTVVAEEGEVEVPSSVGGDDDSEESGNEIGESTGTVGSRQQYGIDPYVPWSRTLKRQHEDGDEFGGWDGDDTPDTMTIGDVNIPGVYEAEEHGEGKKSQYLNETQGGGGDSSSSSGGDGYLTEDGEMVGGSGDGDGSGSDDSSGGGDQVPPLTVDVQAYVGGTTYEELLAMHETPATEETYTVSLGKIELEDCELVELTRGLTAEMPNIYECTITVREYREYEVVDSTVQQTGGGSNAPTGSGSPGELATDVQNWADGPPSGESMPDPQQVSSIDESIGDGQALHNVYSTGGATINVSGDGWRIQNVAIEGEPRITLQGSGIIENVYVDASTGGDRLGFWVAPEHAGDILFRFIHFTGFIDNTIYASPPGNSSEHPSPGNDGRVGIEYAYCVDNDIADFRLGSDGSYVRNSVSANPSTRSMWGYYNTTSAINCDFDGTVVAGEDAWSAGQTAVVELENTRVGGGTAGPGTVNGSSAGSPNTGGPPDDRVPMNPTEAYEGRFYSEPPGGGGGGGGGGTMQ